MSVVVTPEIYNQLSLIKSGIPSDRILNLNDISLIKDVVKCPLCNEITYNPRECETCGILFCEDCINQYSKLKTVCPSGCNNIKLSKVKKNNRLILDIIKLKCKNYPECNYENNYWNIVEHESKCEFQKIKCPNKPCNFEGHFKMLKDHLKKDCNYLNFKCGFCQCMICKKDFENHLEEHNKEKTFFILDCGYCGSSENLRRCICNKSICLRCLNEQKNLECKQTCYLFQNNTRFTSGIYNCSKYPLPKNFEIKLYFISVDWIRTGISFSNDIINEQTDANCPQYDIYCILEDLMQFYTKNNGWKNCFTKFRKLKAGDFMTINFKNGDLKYSINDVSLGSSIHIDDSNKSGEPYLFVHVRNDRSKAEIIYISEIFN